MSFFPASPARRGRRHLHPCRRGHGLAMISAALAIDIGCLAHEARDDQKVADLSAIDAFASALADRSHGTAQAARTAPPATASPTPTRATPWSSSGRPTKTGPFSSNTADLATATVVKVTATSPHKNSFPFVAGRTSMTRSGTADEEDHRRIHARLLAGHVEPHRQHALNRIMTAMLGSARQPLARELAGPGRRRRVPRRPAGPTSLGTRASTSAVSASCSMPTLRSPSSTTRPPAPWL